MTAAISNTTHSYRAAQALTPTILLVEDEFAVREVTREALEMGGYLVLEASGPEDAARIAGELSTQIDLLLTDVVMPGMSGPDLARHVGAIRPGLVTIFMSGYTKSEVLGAAALGSSYGHIQKPFTVDSLLSRVAQALATRWNAGDNDRPAECPSP